MRLLCDPHRAERIGHRFRLIVSHPARDDYCGTGLGGAHQAPRVTVAEAPPKWASWASDNSFPHG